MVSLNCLIISLICSFLHFCVAEGCREMIQILVYDVEVHCLSAGSAVLSSGRKKTCNSVSLCSGMPGSKERQLLFTDVVGKG